MSLQERIQTVLLETNHESQCESMKMVVNDLVTTGGDTSVSELCDLFAMMMNDSLRLLVSRPVLMHLLEVFGDYSLTRSLVRILCIFYINSNNNCMVNNRAMLVYRKYAILA